MSGGLLPVAPRSYVGGRAGQELANSVFTPTQEEINKSEKIIAAMNKASEEGKGAVSLDGRLIDIASIRMAEALLAKAKLCN